VGFILAPFNKDGVKKIKKIKEKARGGKGIPASLIVYRIISFLEAGAQRAFCPKNA